MQIFNYHECNYRKKLWDCHHNSLRRNYSFSRVFFSKFSLSFSDFLVEISRFRRIRFRSVLNVQRNLEVHLKDQTLTPFHLGHVSLSVWHWWFMHICWIYNLLVHWNRLKITQKTFKYIIKWSSEFSVHL